ncbi:hypothetical protein QQP08_002737 [Theobroma cacao]|nr:hypothetical protein QQP08_002737 [Theobroma cacao]
MALRNCVQHITLFASHGGRYKILPFLVHGQSSSLQGREFFAYHDIRSRKRKRKRKLKGIILLDCSQMALCMNLIE